MNCHSLPGILIGTGDSKTKDAVLRWRSHSLVGCRRVENRKTILFRLKLREVSTETCLQWYEKKIPELSFDWWIGVSGTKLVGRKARTICVHVCVFMCVCAWGWGLRKSVKGDLFSSSILWERFFKYSFHVMMTRTSELTWVQIFVKS